MDLLFRTAYKHKDLDNIIVPKAVLNVKTKYLSEIDVIQQFLDENVIEVKSDKSRIKTTELYERFKISHSDNKMCSRDFYKALEMKGLKKVNADGLQYFKNARIKFDD